jgi:biopolymer transport protein ExbB
MNPTLVNQAPGLAHYWAQGDAVTHLVAYVLLLMSIASWYYIFSKAWNAWRIRKNVGALEGFWKASTLEEAIGTLKQSDSENILIPLAAQSMAAATLHLQAETATSLNAQIDPDELITRTLRQEITRVSQRLEKGLTLLASIGSTAPFIGLFGTVWGIYHALTAIAFAGIMQIDKVAGPVGEALIMTALGLIVAIPAVLAYNAFTRINRITMAQIDGFAHDLHAYQTTGTRARK